MPLAQKIGTINVILDNNSSSFYIFMQDTAYYSRRMRLYKSPASLKFTFQNNTVFVCQGGEHQY